MNNNELDVVLFDIVDDSANDIIQYEIRYNELSKMICLRVFICYNFMNMEKYLRYCDWSLNRPNSV